MLKTSPRAAKQKKTKTHALPTQFDILIGYIGVINGVVKCILRKLVNIILIVNWRKRKLWWLFLCVVSRHLVACVCLAP